VNKLIIATLAAAGAAALAACASPPAERPVAAAAAPAAPVFQSDRITVQTRGDGPDVILIPGLSSSPTVWAGVTRDVPGYRYHLVQVNGFAGVPARGNADGPVAAPVAEEIARYIRESGLQRPAVVGHSMGGTIGMMLAARHPAAVGRLMVVDMIPWMGVMFGAPGATPETVRPVAEQLRTAMSAPPTPQSEAFQTQTINSMIKTESLRAGPLAEARASDRMVSANAFHELIVTDLRPELARIAAPTTVLYVRPPNAPLTEAQMDAAYQASYATLPGARLKRIDDAWHFIMFDQPARFAEELRMFLAAS
jgi:pimeloyl-ACP methyl ester carboxylesterase